MEVEKYHAFLCHRLSFSTSHISLTQQKEIGGSEERGGGRKIKPKKKETGVGEGGHINHREIVVTTTIPL